MSIINDIKIKQYRDGDDEIIYYEIIDEMGSYFEVNPETVGQFTGLSDKGGKDIYEGDRVKDNSGSFGTNEVVFVSGSFHLSWAHIISKVDKSWLEVVGNAHDEGEDT